MGCQTNNLNRVIYFKNKFKQYIHRKTQSSLSKEPNVFVSHVFIGNMLLK